MPAAEVSAESARALAQEILGRSDYAQYRRGPSELQRWVDSLSAWLVEQFERVAAWIPDWMVAAWDGFWATLGELVGAAFGDDALVVVVRLALAIVVLGALGILVHRMIRAFRAASDPAAAAPVVHEAAGPRLIAEADRFAREGRFLEAAHCTQLASLQLLLAKKCIELERSDPNRTLRRRLKEAPLPASMRARFLLLLDRLEGEWFRDRHEDQGLYGDWRNLHREIQALPGLR